MPAAAPMQRKSVRRTVVAVLAILAVSTLAALAVLRYRLRLTAGDERRQPLDIGVVFDLLIMLLRTWLILLRLLLRLRLILLRLALLLARIKRLLLARCEGLAGHGRLVALVFVIVIGGIAAGVALLRLKIGLRLAKLFLSGGDQAEIMLGVLIIIFRSDRVAGALRVARELKVFLGDMRRGPANFYVLPVGLVHSRQRVLMMATTLTPVTTAHTFILTVSHGLLFRNPLNLRRHRRRRFSSPDFIQSAHIPKWT
jgi:hypothetical protein